MTITLNGTEIPTCSFKEDYEGQHLAPLYPASIPLQNPDQHQSEFWLNIGIEVSDGNGGTELINLPVGVPFNAIDRALTERARSIPEVNKKRWLRERMADVMKLLRPGQEVATDLTVSIRRIAR